MSQPIFSQYSASEELLQRLASADVEANDVLFYLDGERAALLNQHPDYTPLAVEHFFSPSDLNIYRDAMAWWPRMDGLPAGCVAPSMFQLLYQYHDDTYGRTFVERLTKRAEAAQAWLAANKLDAKPDERKRAANAERQRRHRLRKAANDDVEAARMRWQRLREDRKAELEILALAITNANRAFQEACVQRKTRKIELDAEVAAAKADYDALMKTGSAPNDTEPDVD